MPVSEYEDSFVAETRSNETTGRVPELSSVAGTRDAITQTEEESSQKQTSSREETCVANRRISISKLLG